MRTLIYARYSSALQNPRSIADQVAACRKRAEAEGWQIAEVYSDSAISGAAGIEDTQRPGLAAMLGHVERETGRAGAIAQVLTESTDRLARHQGDAFALRERIEHSGARIFTLMDGVVDDITGTIKGLFDARHRKDLAQRVRRGQRGNVQAGKSSGGVAYGYRKISRFDDAGDQIRGLREVDDDRADIIRRIYREYAAGRSARQIVVGLNEDRIPAPRGGDWRASTLIGHRKSGTAILANPIYIGRLVYGRTKSVTDPRTRKRATVASHGNHVTGEAPHLRIIEDDLWAEVQAQLDARSLTRPERQRRPRHLLSGLGRCGTCGQNWIVTRGDWFGCSGVVEGSTCTNRRLIKKDEYQRRVLDDLRDQMLAPEVVEAYLDEYRREHAKIARAAIADRSKMERQIGEADRRIARLVAAIADGAGEFAEVKQSLADAKAVKADAERTLASANALPQIALHPHLARQYRAAIEDLERELADEATAREARPQLRALIDHVIVTPSPGKRGVDLQVIRHIDEIFALSSAQKATG